MASNYVSKGYMETVDRNIYFEDVRLQMEAKLWGEEYNRHRPPKQVPRLIPMPPEEPMTFRDLPHALTRVSSGGHHADVRGGDDGETGEAALPPGALHRGQVHQVQLQLRFCAGRQHPPDPSGEWRRGCSPWLLAAAARRGDNGVLLTSVVPLQAFSHFTFERSGHQLIVVDIQGVGDLYTDPQIHTEKGTDFGDGNLGTARASGWAEARGVNSPGFVWMCCRRARHGALLPLPPVQQDLQEHGPDAL